MLTGQTITFDSLGSFLTQCGHNPQTDTSDTAWLGGLTPDEIRARADKGDKTLTVNSQTLIDRLERDLELPMTSAYRVTPAVFGPRINMSEYLAGNPTCFRRKVKQESDVAPLKIYVSICGSAGVKADVLKTRGSYILAFLAIVGRYRPIDLVTVLEFDLNGKYHYALTTMESRPINLSQAGFVIGHPGFLRYLGYCYARNVGVRGTWNWVSDKQNAEYPQRMRERIGAGDSDILIPGAHLYDPLVSNPEAWLLDQLKTMGILQG